MTLVSAQRILLIIGGGIAAYKCLDLIRRLRERGHTVRCVMTKAAHEFITPLSVGALTNERVFTDLFDLDDEREIGHIRLARDTEVVVVAPATADLIAKMATGQANDLATAVLLATDKPIVVAPAMNPRMWLHPATRRNTAQLEQDGAIIVGPAIGEMAERGEAGPGRLADTADLIAAIERALTRQSTLKSTPVQTSQHKSQPVRLRGRHVIVTSGPTHEPIDPVRYIANHSSGKQGHAIAAAAHRHGATVTLISGPVSIAPPDGVRVINVVTAADMMRAVELALPADIAIFAAAVADWHVTKPMAHKLKKSASSAPPPLKLAENPDILRTIGHLTTGRPQMVVGFAAETDDVLANAAKKLSSKAANWIVANDVSHNSGMPGLGVMGSDVNTVHLVTSAGVESWPIMSKSDVADRLMARIADHLEQVNAVDQPNATDQAAAE